MTYNLMRAKGIAVFKTGMYNLYLLSAYYVV